MNAETIAQRLGPLAYQRAVVDYLRSEEPGVWEWFSSNRFREKHAEKVRLDILKATYRLEREGHRDLYTIADEVRAALGLEIPLTVYQAPAAEGGMNAFLAWIPGEAHVVLKGPVLSALRSGELRAILGHELSHAILYDLEGGAFLVAGQVLEAMAGDANADPSHVESRPPLRPLHGGLRRPGLAARVRKRGRLDRGAPQGGDGARGGERRELPPPGRGDLRAGQPSRRAAHAPRGVHSGPCARPLGDEGRRVGPGRRADAGREAGPRGPRPRGTPPGRGADARPPRGVPRPGAVPDGECRRPRAAVLPGLLAVSAKGGRPGRAPRVPREVRPVDPGLLLLRRPRPRRGRARARGRAARPRDRPFRRARARRAILGARRQGDRALEEGPVGGALPARPVSWPGSSARPRRDRARTPVRSPSGAPRRRAADDGRRARSRPASPGAGRGAARQGPRGASRGACRGARRRRPRLVPRSAREAHPPKPEGGGARRARERGPRRRRPREGRHGRRRGLVRGREPVGVGRHDARRAALLRPRLSLLGADARSPRPADRHLRPRVDPGERPPGPRPRRRGRPADLRVVAREPLPPRIPGSIPSSPRRS